MELWQLRQKQSLPLEAKIEMSRRRIREWYDHWDGNVYVSFSGGKDSTVLLHLVREMYPDVPAVFVDTGLEYPEIREFVKTVGNVEWLQPVMGFRKVIEKYGYPVVSKKVSADIYKLRNHNLTARYRNYLMNGDERGSAGTIPNKWKCLITAPFETSAHCCDIIKKRPLKQFAKRTKRYPITGEMAAEGGQREKMIRENGCNALDTKEPKSMPLAYWTEGNIWEYKRKLNLDFSKIYDMGYTRTGCMFCAFGVHLEQGQNRFQRMKHTHPKQWHYCMHKLGMAKVLDYIGVEWGAQMDIYDYDNF